MKITHNKVGQNLNLNDSAKAEKTESPNNLNKTKSAPSLFDSTLADPSSKVELSERALDAKKIKELAVATPDVDQAKVEKFRKLIDEGKYSVDSQAVADRMVDEHLMTS